MVINEESGYAYIVGAGSSPQPCGPGLHIVSLHEPDRPQYAGCFLDSESRYTHDAQCVIYRGPDAEHVGKELCFGSNVDALSIADVSDKDNPVPLARTTYPNAQYAHQGWLTDDQRYFYMNDEADEMGGSVEGTRTLIWDVADLDDPQLIHEFVSHSKSSDHNLYVKGDLMYQSNYTAGLRILDISDRTRPVEVGFFDTVSAIPDAPGFYGSWSNYPFFDSGTIVVTSINEGLFVVRKRHLDL